MAFALRDESTTADLLEASQELSQLVDDQAASDPPDAAEDLNGKVVLVFRTTADLAYNIAYGDYHTVDQGERQLDRLLTEMDSDIDDINARCRN